MTNKEKAIELGYEKYPENKSYSTITETMQDYNYQHRKPFIEGALAMAEWKDEQMIEKACEWLEENLWAGLSNPKQRPQFINDFKKAMMEE